MPGNLVQPFPEIPVVVVADVGWVRVVHVRDVAARLHHALDLRELLIDGGPVLESGLVDPAQDFQAREARTDALDIVSRVFREDLSHSHPPEDGAPDRPLSGPPYVIA